MHWHYLEAESFVAGRDGYVLQIEVAVAQHKFLVVSFQSQFRLSKTTSTHPWHASSQMQRLVYRSAYYCARIKLEARMTERECDLLVQIQWESESHLYIEQLH